VAAGLDSLMTNSITSVPVYDVNQNRYNTFLSYLDICCHTLRVEKMYKDQKISGDDRETAWKFSTCSEVSNLSQTCSFQYLKDDDNFQTALLKMVSLSNVRRFPVMNLKDDLVGILTQSEVINVLAQKIDLFPFSKLTIDELNLGTLREIKAVTQDSKVIEAFNLLVEYHIYGVPVVDNQKVVIGNISASDIQLIVENFEFTTLESTIRSVLPNTHQKRSPICIHPTQTVAEAFKLMSREKIHRLFIIDPKTHQLQGLISPVDLIQALLDRSV